MIRFYSSFHRVESIYLSQCTEHLSFRFIGNSRGFFARFSIFPFIHALLKQTQLIYFNVNDLRSFATLPQQQRKIGLNGTRTLSSAMPVQCFALEILKGWLINDLVMLNIKGWQTIPIPLKNSSYSSVSIFLLNTIWQILKPFMLVVPKLESTRFREFVTSVYRRKHLASIS